MLDFGFVWFFYVEPQIHADDADISWLCLESGMNRQDAEDAKSDFGFPPTLKLRRTATAGFRFAPAFGFV